VAGRRSAEAAARWQERLDGVIVVAALLAVLAVALQTAHGDAKVVGEILSWAVWAVFALEAAVMLSLSPSPGLWARGHVVDLLVLLVASPVWPLVVRDLLVAEVAPALTVLEATKLAKLVKATKAVHRRAGRALAAAVLLAALAVAVLVLRPT
jgi:hypothetical protein